MSQEIIFTEMLAECLLAWWKVHPGIPGSLDSTFLNLSHILWGHEAKGMRTGAAVVYFYLGVRCHSPLYAIRLLPHLAL